MRLSAIVAVTLAACGRIGFDSSSDALAIDADVMTVCSGPSLVAYWRLDETSGATVIDSVGGVNGAWTDDNDGTVANEAVTGRRGGALELSADRSISVVGFTVPAEGTFSAWLRSTFDDTAMPGDMHPMVFDAPAPRTTLSFVSDMDSYSLRTDMMERTQFAPTMDFTDWFHITATWSATSARLFLDGAPVGAVSTQDARSTSPQGLWLGTRGEGDRWWTGTMDDVRFYDRALSVQEVAALFACP